MEVKKMPEKDPSTYGLLTYAWVVALSMWGGLASFFRKLREGKVRPFNISELVGELVVSGLAGIITFFLCEWSNTSQLLSAALVGISGHMGSRAMFAMEGIFAKKFEVQVPPQDKPQAPQQ